MEDLGIREQSRSQPFNTILFSLNLGFAFSLALFGFVVTWRTPIYAPELIQKFLMNFETFLLRRAPLSVPPHDHWRGIVFWELGFVAVMAGVALLVLGLRWIVSRTRIAQFLLDPMAGITAILAVPTCWFCMLEITRPEPQMRQRFWSTCGILFILEIGATAALVFFIGKRSFRWGIVIFAAHYLLWGYVIVGLSGPPNVTSLVLSPIFPLSGVAWLRVCRRRLDDSE
jgi:ABC-type Na+ efflux pump permease subunit